MTMPRISGNLHVATNRMHWAGGLTLGFALMIQLASAAPDAAPATAPAATPVATPAVVPEATPAAAPAVVPTVVPATSSVPASNMRISQARAATPGVAVYLDIRAESGEAVANVRAVQLQAEIGPYPASTKSLQAFSSSGEGIAYIFLVDVSKSLKPDQFAKIRNALLQWTEKMGAKDRAAIVSFGESVKTAQDFTADKAVLKTKIGELALTDLHTHLNEGLVRALDLGRRGDADLPRRRVIVTLTDGVADAVGGSTRDDTMARIKEEPVPIYAIGFAAASVSARDKDEGFKLLGAFAHASGGAFVAAGAVPVDELFAKIHKMLGEAYLLTLDCATCPGDGRAYPLRVKLQADNRVLTATSDVRLAPGAVAPVVPAMPPPVQVEDSLPLWVWLAGGAGIVAVLGLLLSRRKKAAPAHQPPVPDPTPDARVAQTIAVPIDLAVTAMPKARPTGIPIRLTAVSGTQHGREWLAEVRAETVIGRSHNCAVVIDDDSEVSSRNSVLSAEGGLLFVDDLGSTNGTAVNGSPIAGRRRVGDGDLILVGRTELRLTVAKSAG
jgi:VWFA-related protein